MIPDYSVQIESESKLVITNSDRKFLSSSASHFSSSSLFVSSIPTFFSFNFLFHFFLCTFFTLFLLSFFPFLLSFLPSFLLSFFPSYLLFSILFFSKENDDDDFQQDQPTKRTVRLSFSVIASVPLFWPPTRCHWPPRPLLLLCRHRPPKSFLLRCKYPCCCRWLRWGVDDEASPHQRLTIDSLVPIALQKRTGRVSRPRPHDFSPFITAVHPFKSFLQEWIATKQLGLVRLRWR